MSNLSSLLLGTVLALAALTACNKDNPNFCEGAAEECMGIDAPIDSPPETCDQTGPDPECPADNPVCTGGACVGACNSDTDCAGRPPNESVCHIGSGACVQCDEDDRQAMPGAEDECTAPQLAVCDAQTHTCRACLAHSECLSGVCDNGRCVPEGEIVFLNADNGNDASAMCTRAEPCATLNRGVDVVQAAAPGARTVIFLAADLDTQYLARGTNGTADFNDVDVFVLGTDATVTRTGAGATMEVKGGSNVRIEGLNVTGGNGASGYGYEISAASTVELFKAGVNGNGSRGISSTGGSTLVVRRSKITNNQGGGIFVDTGKVTLVNNLITGNGNVASSMFGGLSLNLTENPNVIEFNTVVLNSALAGSPDGVACFNNTVIGRNNIIVGAIGNPLVTGTCLHTFTFFTPMGPVGEGNMNVATVDLGMYAFTSDYHIGGSSIVVGRAQPGALTGEAAFDVDSEARPRGASPNADVGADEVQ